MRNRHFQLFVLAMALMLFGFEGLAQEKRSPEDLAKLEEEAWKAADAGDLPRAIEIWEDIMQEITGEGLAGVHKNLAVAYGMLKKHPETWYHLTSYLEKSGKEDTKAGKRLEKLEGKLVKTHRKVVVSCDPDATILYFGLEPTGTAYACPITWWFEPGKRFIYVEKTGFRSQTAQYDVRERGEKGSWVVKLVELPKFGHLVIKGEGKAIQVFLNGSLEGKVPFKRKLKEGTYELMVGKPGEMPWKKTVVIKANATVVEEPPNAQKKVAGDQLPDSSDPNKDPDVIGTPRFLDDDKPAKRSKAGPVALLAGGLGVVVVGAILNGVGYGKEGDLYDEYNPGAADGKSASEHNPAVEDAQSQYETAYADEVKPLKTWSTVFYVVGGAAATGGLIWLIVEATRKPADKKTGIKVSPMMGPGTAGAVFGLEF